MSTAVPEFKFDSPQAPIDEAALRTEVESATGGKLPSAPAAAVDATARPADDTTPAASATPSPSSQAASPEETEVKTHTIKVNGQEYVVTAKDLLDGHMRFKDYTQKTQAIAERERQADARIAEQQQRAAALEQELARVDQFLQDQAAMDAYIEKAFGRRAAGNVPAPVIDNPEAPLTAKQVADIARYNAEQVRISTEASIKSQLADERARLTQERDASAKRQVLESEVNAHLDSIFKQHPKLKTYDGMEDELFMDAMKFQPKSLDEAKELLTKAAERKIAWAKSLSSDDSKTAAAAAAKLVKNGIEPPGGTGIRAAAATKKLTMQTKDRNELIAAATAELEAMVKARQ